MDLRILILLRRPPSHHARPMCAGLGWRLRVDVGRRTLPRIVCTAQVGRSTRRSVCFVSLHAGVHTTRVLLGLKRRTVTSTARRGCRRGRGQQEGCHPHTLVVSRTDAHEGGQALGPVLEEVAGHGRGGVVHVVLQEGVEGLRVRVKKLCLGTVVVFIYINEWIVVSKR